jgi:hypothetical protein
MAPRSPRSATPSRTLRLRTLRALGGLAPVLALASCRDQAPASEAWTNEPLVTQTFDGAQTCEIAREGVTEAALTARKVRVVLNRPIASQVTDPDLVKNASLTAGLVGEALGTDLEINVDLIVPEGALGRAIDFETAANNAKASYGERGRWVIATDADGRPTLHGDSEARLVAKDPKSKEGWTASCRWDLIPATGPRGPLGYEALGVYFPNDATTSSMRPLSSIGTVSQALESGCGSELGKTATGLNVATFALDFVPGVGPALGLATRGGAIAAGFIGGKKSDACMAATFDAINQALATQASQIEGIIEGMGLAQDAFYAEAYTNRLTDAQQWAYLWKHNGLDVLSPTSADQGGIFGNFMVLAGLWSDLQGPSVAGVDVKQIAVNTVLFEDLRSYVQSQTQPFQAAVSDLTGTQVQGPCVIDCYKNVAAKSNSALIGMYGQTFEVLKARMNVLLPYRHPNNTFAAANVVPAYDSYNNTLTSFFQRAMVGLQQAYTLESLVNQLNYNRGAAASSPSGVAQINALNAIGETHYDYNRQVVNGVAPSEATQVKAFNQAQKKLAYFYAARFNQLYLNTLNYIVSDVPAGPQQYPTADITWVFNGKTHRHAAPAYASEVGKALKATYDRSTSTDQGPTPMSFLPKAADGSWQARGVLYQYPGLRDVAKCLNAVQAYNQSVNQVSTLADALAQPDACPAIFAAADGKGLNEGSYDGDTLRPYVEVDGKMQLAGLMTDNLKFCDETAPALGWLAPTGSFVGNDAGLETGKTYVSCGRWYLPKKNDGAITCAGMPRGHCPASNEAGAEDFYQTEREPTGRTFSPVGETSTSIYGGSLGDKQELNGNDYVFWTGLFGNWPLDMRSCAAIVTSSSPFSASYSQSRAEPELSGSLGCQLGYFGNSWNSFFQWTLALNARAKFGIRLPNHTNVGGAGAFSGFVLPVMIEGASGGSGGSSYGVQAQLKLMRSGTMERDGFHCRNTGTVTTADNRNPIRCTLKDGTQYDLKLTGSIGSDGHFRSYLDLKVVTP